MADNWKVVRNNEEGRTVFSGTERDARRYIVTNHPRVHVNHGASADDEPRPDVHLVSPGGDRTWFRGTTDDLAELHYLADHPSWSDNDEPEETTTFAGEDED